VCVTPGIEVSAASREHGAGPSSISRGSSATTVAEVGFEEPAETMMPVLRNM